MNFGTIESQEVQQQVLPDRLPDSDSIWLRQDDQTAKTLTDVESESQQEVEKQLMEIEDQLEKEQQLAMEIEKDMEKQFEIDMEKAKLESMELEKQKELEVQREKEKAMELEKELEMQREKEKAMEFEKELEMQREKEKAMEFEKELEEEMERQFENDMEKAKQASMEVENEQGKKTSEFPIKRDLEDEHFNRLYRAHHGRLLKMDAVEFAKAKKQMQIHPKFVEFLVSFDCPHDEVDLMASWGLWCEHKGVVKVEEPIPPTFERHTTKENTNNFFDPNTYKVTEDGYGDGLPSPEKPGEHGDGPGAELPPKSESEEDPKIALLTAGDQRKLRASRKEENAEKRTRMTKKGPEKSSKSDVPAEKEKKRPVEELEEPKENDINKRRKSVQLVEKDRQEEFKKNLKLSFNQVFCLGKASMYF